MTARRVPAGTSRVARYVITWGPAWEGFLVETNPCGRAPRLVSDTPSVTSPVPRVTLVRKPHCQSPGAGPVSGGRTVRSPYGDCPLHGSHLVQEKHGSTLNDRQLVTHRRRAPEQTITQVLQSALLDASEEMCRPAVTALTLAASGPQVVVRQARNRRRLIQMADDMRLSTCHASTERE